jgi:hypothetical protein
MLYERNLNMLSCIDILQNTFNTIKDPDVPNISKKDILNYLQNKNKVIFLTINDIYKYKFSNI